MPQPAVINTFWRATVTCSSCSLIWGHQIANLKIPWSSSWNLSPWNTFFALRLLSTKPHRCNQKQKCGALTFTHLDSVGEILQNARIRSWTEWYSVWEIFLKAIPGLKRSPIYKTEPDTFWWANGALSFVRYQSCIRSDWLEKERLPHIARAPAEHTSSSL